MTTRAQQTRLEGINGVWHTHNGDRPVTPTEQAFIRRLIEREESGDTSEQTRDTMTRIREILKDSPTYGSKAGPAPEPDIVSCSAEKTEAPVRKQARPIYVDFDELEAIAREEERKRNAVAQAREKQAETAHQPTSLSDKETGQGIQ